MFFFVTRDLDLSLFDFKINQFVGLIVEHFFVKFADTGCIGFWDIGRENRRYDTIRYDTIQ